MSSVADFLCVLSSLLALLPLRETLCIRPIRPIHVSYSSSYSCGYRTGPPPVLRHTR